ncbi:uroporphyrinogen-III C-methyltransferase [Massilia endophytica]|uniref:uroporphyrinogen-III C-methyltransferase n=1 Tax=Massilia endophytica TaxID=2899220 RepID=UPI001E3C7B10|nr:uroporphyrinogen-III C-methyltransferase [Massilia endophytica]UGQ47921.1 uroporphyrinogen-III C-methyltransferase [Massilia endophytica]
MSDLPTIPDPAAPKGNAAEATPIPAAPVTVPAEPGLADALQRPLTIAVIVLGILLAAETWTSHKQVRGLREEMARRLQKGDASNAETGQIVRQVQESTKELQIKVGVLEGRQQEAQSQQLALEQLYNDLSKNRDEWALAEIEQVLSTASQQLQLAGNVSGALIALQNADRSLSRSDKPQFITIRRAIAKDMEKLKALPSVDSVGLAVRLDNVIAQVDTLPMLADEKPTLPAAPEKPAAKPSKKGRAAKEAPPEPVESPWLAKLQGTWNAWSSEMWTDVRQLIRVRSVDTPDALMLSPGEAYFLRENLKLRLLNARMALLSRNEAAFRADLLAAQEALVRYFDTRAKQTQTVQALLRQVQGSNLAIEMPTLADSLNAVRNYKAKP